MTFNKTAYYVPIKTNNGTNSKDYSSIFNNHTISIDFKLETMLDIESTLFVREGGEIGLYIEQPNSIKFIWKEEAGRYNEIRTSITNIKEKNNIKVSIGEYVELYVNDHLIDRVIKRPIANSANKRFIIGAESPYSLFNEKWFFGEITDFSVYENSVETMEKNTYISLDFVNNSKFKTFDKSGAGNHGVLFENPKDVEYSITEYNKLGPKQKII